MPKISQVMIKWRRRASHLGRLTLWHNGRRATQLAVALFVTQRKQAPQSGANKCNLKKLRLIIAQDTQ